MSLATSPKQQAWLKQREAMAERQKLADLKEVLSTPAGRRVIYRLIYVECGLQSTVLGAPSSLLHEYEGRRDVASRLVLYLQQHCQQEYLEMVAEAMKANADDALILQSARVTATQEGDE